MAIVFLCIVLALLNSLTKFFVYFMNENLNASAFDFLATYLPGDIIGSFVFIIFAKFMMKIFHLGNHQN